MSTKIHDHIMSRAEGSEPGEDMRALGFDPEELYQEMILNDNMTTNMIASFSVGAVQAPQAVFAKYAMTWMGIGMGMYKEARDRSDDFPTLTDNPD